MNFRPQKSTAMRCGALLAMVLVAAAAALAGGPPQAGNAPSLPIDGPDPLQGQKTPSVLREGETLVDRLGAFRLVGERIAFYPTEGGRPIRVLENLALERIAQVLAETSSQRQWSVSGRITEYRGENYLLVSRALLKSRSAAASALPSKPSKPTGQTAPRARRSAS